MHRSTTVAALAAIGLLAAGCATPGHAPPTSADGVWRTDGYGWVVAIDNGQARTYDVTSLSCLLNHTTTQLGGAGPDGVVSFGRKNTAAETVHAISADRASLRLLGTAADIDMVRVPGLPTSCAQPVRADPVSTFDVFWATFAENYNSTVRKHVDWNALRARYRPMVTTSTTPDQLYKTMVAMIAPLGDDHATIDGPNDDEFEGKRLGTRDDDDLSGKKVTRAIDAHLRDLGVANLQTWAGKKIAYADLPGGLGYLRITAFQAYDTNDDLYVERAQVLQQALDAVFTQVRVSAWRGLIIDLQYNEGGDDELGLTLAGRLTDTPYLAYTKLARNDPTDPTRYGRARAVTVSPGTGPRYTGPVRLLTSDLTVSAGETCIEALMRRTPAPTRVGTTTQGVFADDMERKLPNGWTFTVGNEDYLAPDGHNYEGVGIPPTTQTTELFTKAQRDLHQDSALDIAMRTPW